MDDLSNMIKSIDGQVSKINSELTARISRCKTKEEVEAVIKYINENISKNQSVSHIAPSLIKSAEKRKKEIVEVKIRPGSVSKVNERGILISPYNNIKDYPSFLPYKDWFFMWHALWYLGAIDARFEDTSVLLPYFEGHLESILKYCRDENDKKELLEFFEEVASMGGFAKNYYPNIEKTINNFEINKKRTDKLQNLGRTPYKDIKIELPIYENNPNCVRYVEEIIRLLEEIDTSKGYNIYWQNKDDKRIIDDSKLSRIKENVQILIDNCESEKDLDVMLEEFKKLDKGFGKSVFESHISTKIMAEKKKRSASKKFSKKDPQKVDNYEKSYEDLVEECKKIENEFEEIVGRKFVQTSDLDELDALILRSQKILIIVDEIFANEYDKERVKNLYNLYNRVNTNIVKMRNRQDSTSELAKREEEIWSM